MLHEFISKTENKGLVIGILGLGYVGIPLAQRCAEVGFKVVGIDINQARVDGLNAGKSPIQHISNGEIELMVSREFRAMDDFSAVGDCDAIIICVPTPLSKKREPDLSYVVATMDAISPYLRKGHLVSLESTTWPGTTDEILRPYLEQAGLNIGEDAFLVYSPEREDPGNAHFNTQSIPKVLGGQTEACTQAGKAVYEMIVDKVVSVSSTRAAEMVKLLENIHRSVNIGLVNEMKIVCQKMGLDVFEVIDAAATKPFGFTPYYPGPGIGGHCIPIDPFYLTWKAREYGVQTRFIETAGEINASMPQYVVDHLVKALNERGLALKGAKVLVLGIAYKKDVDDMRESPSVFIMELLRNFGANISYHDSNVPVFPDMREHDFDLSSVPLTAENLQESDAVLVLTNHTDVDYALIQKHSKLIIDTRGQYRGSKSPNIQRA